MNEVQSFGYVDDIYKTNDKTIFIKGWGFFKLNDEFLSVNTVNIYSNGNLIFQCKTDIFREDVLNAFKISEIKYFNCGFEIEIPVNIFILDPYNNTSIFLVNDEKEEFEIHGPWGMLSGEKPKFLNDNLNKNYFVNKLHGIAISPTSKCNLRCKYCTINSSEYIEYDLSGKSIENILKDLKSFEVKEIHLGIMGEPTLDDRFFNISRILISEGFLLSCATNLNKSYTDDEILVLLDFETLEISVDSFNKKNLKNIRTADVRNVLHNLSLINILAKLKNKTLPKMTLSVVLNDLVIDDLKETLYYCKLFNINQMQLLDMRISYRDADFSNLPKRVFETSRPEYVKEEINKVINLSKELKISINIDSNIQGFLDGKNIDLCGNEKVAHVTDKLPTRLCIAPWSRLYVFANGDVTPCFNFSCVGRINEENRLENVVNNTRMQRLRRELLTGDLSLGCQHCVRAHPCSIEDLNKLIKRYNEGKIVRAETFGQPVDFKDLEDNE